MPRADDLPSFVSVGDGIPAESNPLGVKGAGECGTTPATAAVINAIVDALGIRHLEMPATPERVWRALRAAQLQSAGKPDLPVSAASRRSIAGHSSTP